ncbi:HAMP domain-containing protein [Thermococcus sp. GR7]|uniref:methyl-accepting chemotaxis protein n=1 Tax=unclassified Thermococcus TaxID=2627626 RepID=UPI00142F890D|nr:MULTISPECIES: methyl-accepting chemotaxis protein [unclassified Thermococcus]NJE47531.1 HAMP domain-containing protein [Thermococcus sp. GR7]NJE78541.1 HAMP domain-containing protein [Thermococcus sp. GR4]NJF24008.1 HAMP domain-containing protein [Thermococcus sp. GR5]
MEFKKKILAIVVLGLVLVTAVTSGMMIYAGKSTAGIVEEKMRPVVENQAKEAVEAQAEALANEFEAFFKGIETLGLVTKELTIVSLNKLKENGYDFGDPGYADKLRPIILEEFTTLSKAEPRISAIYFGDVNGNMFIYPEQDLPESYDPRVRPWYKKAIEVNGPTWSEPYEDASSGKWVVTFAVPVYYEGKLVGVVGTDIYIDTLTQKIDKIKIGQTGYAYVVSPDGMIYMHPKHEYIMNLNVFDYESLKAVADILRSGKDRDVTIYTWEGVEAVAAGVKIPSTGWYVFTKVPVEEISAPIIAVVNDVQNTTTKTAIMLTGFIILLSIGIIIVAYKLISNSIKPLEALRDVAQALAEGRLSEVSRKLKQIHYIEDDEIGALIKAFEAVGKDLVGTLDTIASKLERLAEGDLSNGLTVEAKGELSGILEDLKDTTHKLKSLISEIVHVTNELEKRANVLAQISTDVTESINQVNEAVQQVSIEAQRQQENINEITEGMRFVAEVSAESVRAMDEFEGAVSEVVSIASEGREKGEVSARQIESIQETMRDIESAVTKVAEMSRSIEEITNVITNIAEQTNLLALNAAIEAARAGEAGRGFAVVAQEIRKLAEESKQAADNIKNIIDQITAEIRDAVDSTRRGVTVVGESAETLRETTNYLTNIADLLQDASGRMGEVKEQIIRTQDEVEKALRALENLAASAEETTASAEEVSSAVQEQTAATEELQRAANDLKNIVQDLREIISRFKL